MDKREEKNPGGSRKAPNQVLASMVEKPQQDRKQVVSEWLSKLDDKKLDKLIALAGIIDDDDTCERIPMPQFIDGGGGVKPHWRVTWEKDE